MLLLIPSGLNPGPLLTTAPPPFLRAGFVHFRPGRSFNGVEDAGIGLYAFGAPMPAAQTRGFQAMHFLVHVRGRDQAAARREAVRAILRGAVAPYERILDPLADDSIWVKEGVRAGRRMTAVVRDRFGADELRAIPVQPPMFDDSPQEWVGFGEDPDDLIDRR